LEGDMTMMARTGNSTDSKSWGLGHRNEWIYKSYYRYWAVTVDKKMSNPCPHRAGVPMREAGREQTGSSCCHRYG